MRLGLVELWKWSLAIGFLMPSVALAQDARPTAVLFENIRAIEAGVKCIDHGQLLDEPAIKLMAEKGVWLSLQPFLEDEDAIPTAPGSDNERKYKQVAAGTDRAYKLARKYGVKAALGADIQFNPKAAERQAYYLPKLVRWYTPAEVLKMVDARQR